MVVGEYFGVDRPDYVSNMLQPTWPFGMAVEVFNAAALFEAASESIDPLEREHVTPFIYRRPERYRLRSVTRTENLSAHRWTVDTAADFEMVGRIISDLYQANVDFCMDDVLALLDRNPSWITINNHIQQKTI
jgi:spore coat polysaccharide biosynthesis protein SpsF